MAEVERSFFLVWSPTGSRPPSVRHDTAERAEAEARRLAAVSPGSEFFVLGAISCSVMRTPGVRTRDLSLARDLIPF